MTEPIDLTDHAPGAPGGPGRPELRARFLSVEPGPGPWADAASRWSALATFIHQVEGLRQRTDAPGNGASAGDAISALASVAPAPGS